MDNEINNAQTELTRTIDRAPNAVAGRLAFENQQGSEFNRGAASVLPPEFPNVVFSDGGIVSRRSNGETAPDAPSETAPDAPGETAPDAPSDNAIRATMRNSETAPDAPSDDAIRATMRNSETAPGAPMEGKDGILNQAAIDAFRKLHGLDSKPNMNPAASVGSEIAREKLKNELMDKLENGPWAAGLRSLQEQIGPNAKRLQK